MTATLEGDEWSAAHPGHILPPVKIRYPLYRRLDGPQSRFGWAENLAPQRDSIPDHPARSSVAIPTELRGPHFAEVESLYFRIIWTNKTHYFLSIYFHNKPLHVSSTLAAHHQEDQLCINSNWYSHALCWLYQMLFIQSWSSWWWAASLVETCRGSLSK